MVIKLDDYLSFSEPEKFGSDIIQPQFRYVQTAVEDECPDVNNTFYD